MMHMFTELTFFQKAATSHCRDDTSGVEIPVSIPYQHIALLRFLLVLILACHCLACSLDLQKVFFNAYFPQLEAHLGKLFI